MAGISKQVRDALYEIFILDILQRGKGNAFCSLKIDLSVEAPGDCSGICLLIHVPLSDGSYTSYQVCKVEKGIHILNLNNVGAYWFWEYNTKNHSWTNIETIEASPTTAGIPMSKVIKAIEYLKPLFT